MGGVPKQRKTKSRQANRRMHLFIKNRSLVSCLKCGKPVLPHTVCTNCGYYKGREVIDVMKKLTKKEKKQKEREIRAKEASGEKETKKEQGLNWEEMSKK
jgi:large subunit ribosomal protein L32